MSCVWLTCRLKHAFISVHDDVMTRHKKCVVTTAAGTVAEPACRRTDPTNTRSRTYNGLSLA